jgi:predicted peroxiredoxin
MTSYQINTKSIQSKKIFVVMFSILTLTFVMNYTNYVYSENIQSSVPLNKTKLVYHLSSDDPWRSTIALSDSNTMLKMGYNVTLLLSIEGVQLGVKDPHQQLGLDMLRNNVTDFIKSGGHVIVCKICLHIVGYNDSDIINGAVIGSPQTMANLLNKTTVVDY